MAKAVEDFGDGVKATRAFVGSNVDDLPVLPFDGGHVSCWELTDEEVEQIVRTRKVFLWVVGRGHPPVSITTGVQTQEEPAEAHGQALSS